MVGESCFTHSASQFLNEPRSTASDRFRFARQGRDGRQILVHLVQRPTSVSPATPANALSGLSLPPFHFFSPDKHDTGRGHRARCRGKREDYRSSSTRLPIPILQHQSRFKTSTNVVCGALCPVGASRFSSTSGMIGYEKSQAVVLAEPSLDFHQNSYRQALPISGPLGPCVWGFSIDLSFRRRGRPVALKCRRFRQAWPRSPLAPGPRISSTREPWWRRRRGWR